MSKIVRAPMSPITKHGPDLATTRDIKKWVDVSYGDLGMLTATGVVRAVYYRERRLLSIADVRRWRQGLPPLPMDQRPHLRTSGK